MGCQISAYLAVGDIFQTAGGKIEITDVWQTVDPTHSTYTFIFTAPNGESIEIPGAGAGAEFTFEALNTVISVVDALYSVIQLKICSPLVIDGVVTGKELVLTFSKDITALTSMVDLVSKIIKVFGGKSAYIEGNNKLVVVL